MQTCFFEEVCNLIDIEVAHYLTIWLFQGISYFVEITIAIYMNCIFMWVYCIFKMTIVYITAKTCFDCFEQTGLGGINILTDFIYFQVFTQINSQCSTLKFLKYRQQKKQYKVKIRGYRVWGKYQCNCKETIECNTGRIWSFNLLIQTLD